MGTGGGIKKEGYLCDHSSVCVKRVLTGATLPYISNIVSYNLRENETQRACDMHEIGKCIQAFDRKMCKERQGRPRCRGKNNITIYKLGIWQ
jgi:hypothetical protein